MFGPRRRNRDLKPMSLRIFSSCQHRLSWLTAAAASILLAAASPAQAVQGTATGIAMAPQPEMARPEMAQPELARPQLAQPGPVQAALQARLAELAQGRAVTVTLPGPAAAGPLFLAAPLRKADALVRFYAARDFRPVWDGPQGPLRLRQLLQAIADAEGQGLPPDSYHADLLQAALEAMTAPDASGAEPPAALRADRDLAASDAFLALAGHHMGGRVDPRSFDREWTIHAAPDDPVPLLQDADITGDIQGALTGVMPAQPGYRALAAALAALRSRAEAGPWPVVPAGPSLKPGMLDTRVPVLRQRLAASGDLPSPPAAPASPPAMAAIDGDGLPGVAEAYEGELLAAVIRFQRRHGLEPDGVVGPRTLAALNVPLADRILQVELNLERWRWLPADLGRRHVLVNIAGYDYRLIEDGVERLYGRTIVGRSYRSTPVFSDRIEYLVLNPTWTVPRKLAVEDKLPQIRKDPDFLQREGFTVYSGWGEDAEAVPPEYVDWHSLSKDFFPYRLVQAPGAANALGQVKFLFPNKYDIYLHDTPSRYLFERANRAFSSGCIRVEHPLALAEYLLQGEPGWNRERIDRVLSRGGEDWIRLREPVPVHLLHWTAWQDPDGSLQLRDDLYGRDARLARALADAAS